MFGDRLVVQGHVPPPVPATGHIITQTRPVRRLAPDPARPIQKGVLLVVGVPPLKPIHGAPRGQQRLRLRAKSVAKLFVRQESGIRCFLLVDRGDHWFCDPTLEQARNFRPQSYE